MFPEFVNQDYQSVRVLLDLLSLDSSEVTNEVIDLPIYKESVIDEIFDLIPGLEAKLEMLSQSDPDNIKEKLEKKLKQAAVYKIAARLLHSDRQVVSRSALGLQTRWQAQDIEAKRENYLQLADGILRRIAKDCGLEIESGTGNPVPIFSTAPGGRGRII